MFDKKFIADAITRSAETAVDRRKLLAMAGIAGVGAAAAVAAPEAANAADPINDGSILNFALTLEYLEAEFYHRAYYGTGLPGALVNGKGSTQPRVRGGSKVPFKTKAIKALAYEIAGDEVNHVSYLRNALGSAKVAEPVIDFKAAFSAAAQAAGVVKAGQSFNPFADEVSFLIGAFIFEDVGVTAYKGAAPLITNKTYLEAAAGILAVEAYHAGIIRTKLIELGLATPSLFSIVQKVSNVRDLVDGPTDDDQGIGSPKEPQYVPTDGNSIVYSRTPGEVLNIVYLNAAGGSVVKGGFFPVGINGDIHRSTAN